MLPRIRIYLDYTNGSKTFGERSRTDFDSEDVDRESVWSQNPWGSMRVYKKHLAMIVGYASVMHICNAAELEAFC